MSTTKHTPGPWKVLPDGDNFYIDGQPSSGSDRAVCYMGLGNCYREQDARLIAAAPELLAFLRELWEYSPDLPDEPLSLYDKGLQRAIKKAKELIDRVEG